MTMSPSSNTIIPMQSLTDHDVLLGRGTGCNESHGNRRFRTIVLEALQQGKGRCITKRDMAKAVVGVVHSNGGRFVRKLSESETVLAMQTVEGQYDKNGKALEPPFYTEVPQSVATEKAKQAFRHQQKVLSDLNHFRSLERIPDVSLSSLSHSSTRTHSSASSASAGAYQRPNAPNALGTAPSDTAPTILTSMMCQRLLQEHQSQQQQQQQLATAAASLAPQNSTPSNGNITVQDVKRELLLRSLTLPQRALLAQSGSAPAPAAVAPPPAPQSGVVANACPSSFSPAVAAILLAAAATAGPA